MTLNKYERLFDFSSRYRIHGRIEFFNSRFYTNNASIKKTILQKRITIKYRTVRNKTNHFLSSLISFLQKKSFLLKMYHVSFSVDDRSIHFHHRVPTGPNRFPTLGQFRRHVQILRENFFHLFVGQKRLRIIMNHQSDAVSMSEFFQHRRNFATIVSRFKMIDRRFDSRRSFPNRFQIVDR